MESMSNEKFYELNACNLSKASLTILGLWLSSKLVKLILRWRIYSKLPHDKSHWLLGHINQLRPITPDEPDHQARMRVFKHFYEKFGKKKLAIVWRLWKPIVVLYHREPIEALLTSKTQLHKGKDYDGIRPWIGDGLLLSADAKWHKRRKLLTPAFHFKILDDFLPIMVDSTVQFIQGLKEQEKDGNPIIDLEQLIPLATLDIICETAMGISVGVIKNPQSEYVKAVSDVTKCILDRVVTPLHWLDFIYNRTEKGKLFNKSTEILRRFSMDVIKERIAKVVEERKGQNYISGKKEAKESGESGNIYFHGKKRRQAFMDTLIDEYLDVMEAGNSSQFTIEDIREEVDTFMFEGHDTTAVALSWTLYRLGHEPEIQERLYQEISENLGDGSSIDVESLAKMKYLDACIKESLRLNPSVPSVQRYLVDDMDLAGYKIPKETTIVMHIFFLHRDPQVWPDPEKYDPGRFMEGKILKKAPPFSYIPFSVGPRNCIGQKFAMMELKILISLMLLNFKIESLGKLEEAQMSFEVVLRPKTPLKVKLVRR